MSTMETGDFRYFVLGAMTELRERTEKMASEFVEKGRTMSPASRARRGVVRTSGKALMGRDMPIMDDLTDMVGRTVERLLGQMGLVTKADIESLERRLQSLERKVNRLAEKEKPPRAAKKIK